MLYTLEDKLKMVEEHELEGKSLSHVSERYGYFDLSALKYLIAICRKCGRDVFVSREIQKYQRDTKLLAIKRVEAGETMRQVALDLELIDPSIVRDWVRKWC